MDGIDIYQGNTGMPSWSDIWAGGFRYVFHKTNEFGPGSPNQTDALFPQRWPELKDAGFIRGSFNLVHNHVGTPEDQAMTAASMLGRLVPGDLGPSLDMEDRDPGHSAAKDPGFWVDFAHRYLDTIESALGRRPIIYTSRSYWQEFTDNSTEFADYPLWVIDVNSTTTPLLPPPWTRWAFWQWHTELNNTAMPSPFKTSDKGIDLDHFNGSIYQLRGLADLEHTSPHVVGEITFVAYTSLDGHIHVLVRLLGNWEDTDVTQNVADAPAAAGDPSAVGVGNEQVIVYRAGDSHVYALGRPGTDLTDHWTVQDITGALAIDDPRILLIKNELHVVYWNENDSQSHMIRRDGVWTPERMSGTAASGSAAFLNYLNVCRVVSRGGTDGHLHEYSVQSGSGTDVDLTAGAHDANGQTPPAATYRPAILTSSDKPPRIVYRAIRGEIWMIERDTLSARLLSLDSAPVAEGSPSAVTADTAHIIYRSGTGDLIDIAEDASGTWHWETISCPVGAAADPNAFYDGSRAGFSFRGLDDSLYFARNVDGAWTCEVAPALASPQTTQ